MRPAGVSRYGAGHAGARGAELRRGVYRQA
jgi:hypothetical protein